MKITTVNLRDDQIEWLKSNNINISAAARRGLDFIINKREIKRELKYMEEDIEQLDIDLIDKEILNGHVQELKNFF
jgi:post-segregation antitoxin (ccd killing protein)